MLYYFKFSMTISSLIVRKYKASWNKITEHHVYLEVEHGRKIVLHLRLKKKRKDRNVRNCFAKCNLRTVYMFKIKNCK